jgi:NADH:ubiquinone oxidoreductase subunit 2 (subunit N)
LTVIRDIINILHTFSSVAVIFLALFISLFFGISNKKWVKLFIAILSAISLAAALFLNIYTFLKVGDFSSFLFNFGRMQMIEVTIMLFSALNIFIFISLFNIDKNHFVKLVMLFLFTVSSAYFLILSNNFIAIFISFGISTVGVFQLITVLNNNISKIKDYIIRFFLVSAAALIIIFIGFSFIYGATDLKNFKQILESGSISNPLTAIGLLMICLGIFLYLFMFPFQGNYLKILRRSDYSSPLIIWFLYMPAGLFMFLKMNNLIFYFIKKNNPYISIAFIVISAACALGGNIGAIKTTSVRRIFAFIFMAVIGLSILPYAMFGMGVINEARVEWLIISNLILLIISFFPLYGILINIERNSQIDSIYNLKGFARTNKYLGINLILILISFCGMVCTAGYLTKFYYFEPFIRYLKGELKLNSGPMNAVLDMMILFIIFTAVILIIVNVIRIIVQLLKKENIQTEIQNAAGIKKYLVFSKFYYLYVTIFTVIILIIGVLGLLEILNAGAGFIPFKITSF